MMNGSRAHSISGVLLALSASLHVGVVRAAPLPRDEFGVPTARPLVEEVDSVGLTVGDVERAIDFYSSVLSFEMVSDVEVAGSDYERLEGVFASRLRVVRMRLGDEFIELTEFLAPKGAAVPEDSRSNDLWFQHIAIIVSDMDRAYAVLRKHRVEHISPGPQTLPEWNPQAGGIRAFYFKDPDHHPLEILQFPAAKGNPKWHRPTDRLFLGIDHTAIAIDDTEQSLRFYRDRLGFEVSGESENHGIEQERLNSVFGARLRITALRAPAGPGIELLEYLAPGSGRPRPAGARANDLLHWRTRLVCADAGRALSALRGSGCEFISPGAVETQDGKLGFRTGVVVRDPDGHAIQLVVKSSPVSERSAPPPQGR